MSLSCVVLDIEDFIGSPIPFLPLLHNLEILLRAYTFVAHAQYEHAFIRDCIHGWLSSSFLFVPLVFIE
jgi:uncharacterized membrane protein